MKPKLKANQVLQLKIYPTYTMQRQKSIFDMIKYEAKQFCLNTALHGYRFIILPKRILLERVIWIIVVLVSLIAALVLLCLAWFSFQQNPTVLVTDSTHYPIWNYPFPAVTICNFNKISKQRAIKMFDKLTKSKFSEGDMNVTALRILFQLINNDDNDITYREFTKLQDLLDVNEIQVDNALQELAPTCDEMLKRCKWKGEEKRCESIFEQIRTTEGFCCTFNYFALKNHKFNGSLANKSPQKARRVSACGYQTALEVLVDSNPDDYFATQIASIGHRVLIHNPYNFPDWTSQSILIEMKTLNLIGVNPTITHSTSNIRSLDVNKRQCLFNEERELFNFRHYNFHNCMIECKMNLTMRFCGCIPFYFHSFEGTFPKPKICTLRDVNCLSENRHLVFTSVPGYDFTNLEENHEYGTEKGECNCLPDCDYVDYLAECSTGILTRQYSTNQLNFYGGIVLQNHSVVRVFFNDLVATKNRRDVSFSWHTLLAYYGGLLGLFVGFSFVSGIEIVYFFTIRLIADATVSHKSNKDNMKLQLPQKINVQPIIYERLDPKRLMLPFEQTEIRRRSNSKTKFTN